MNKPESYKTQHICLKCLYSEFILFTVPGGAIKDWYCNKYMCRIDSDGYCMDYKEDKE